MKSSNDNEINQSKLKILVLHGYRQNAEIFKSKTGSFRKMLHKFADFTYITAPHKVIQVHTNNLGEEVDPDIELRRDEGDNSFSEIYYICKKCS